MPVYHVSNFDVSAVQIDLSANIFEADTLQCDYWVRKEVNFNSGGAIKDDTALNAQFKNVFTTSGGDYVGNIGVTRGSSGRVTFVNAGTVVSVGGTNVLFKDLGVINSDHNLLSSSIYTNVTALRESNNDNTSFNGKARAVLQGLGDVTGLREKMLASLNVGENPDQDRGINEIVPGGIQFAFKVIRKLNLAGSNQDREIFIGILLEQLPP